MLSGPNPLRVGISLTLTLFVINGHAGGSGPNRDSNGNWVQGFSKPIGTTSILMAELWALCEGIHMAKQLNIHSLIVNMDSSDVVNLISSPASTNRLTRLWWLNAGTLSKLSIRSGSTTTSGKPAKQLTL